MKIINVIRQTTAAVFVVAAISFAGCDEDNPGNEEELVKVSGVSLKKSELTLIEGVSETLAATVAPDDAENKAVTWKSDKPEVASVDAEGKVTAVKAGTAIVTVTTDDGVKTATCTVTVTAVTVAVTSVSLNKSVITLDAGTPETLAADITPADAENQAVTWFVTGNTATVDADGKVTAVKAGALTVTVTTDDGGKTATCTVTVNGRMTMTTAKEGEVRLGLAGTGTAVIDWGDGSVPEMVTFKTTSGYAHDFSGATSCTIAIEGKNIKSLSCNNQGLTTLDVTQNTALTCVCLTHNPAFPNVFRKSY